MNKLLIYLGLLSPFVVWLGQDTRVPKFNFVLVIAFGVFLVTLFKEMKRFNKWLYILIGYLFVNTLIMPTHYKIGEILIANNWMWEPFTYILIFSLFIISVSSIRFSRKEVKRISDILIWTGLLVSVYMILQYFGIRQFFGIIKEWDIVLPQYKKMIGTFGQYTMAATYLAIVFPLALIYDWRKSLPILIAILITRSDIAIGAVLISSLYISLIKKRYWATLIVFVLMSVGMFFVTDSGRIYAWKMALEDISKAPYTGYGLGSYSKLFPLAHDSIYSIAHNDPLEFTYNTGLIGFWLLLVCVFTVFYKAKSIGKKYLFGAFLASVFCSLGNYIWQQGAHLYVTCIIVGLIHNETV